MKNRTMLALALLVLVGGATVWKVTRKDPHVRSEGDKKSPLSIKKEDVDELEIAEAGKPAVQLKKEGGEWKLVQPVADRADGKAVDQAIAGLSELKLRDVIAESPESYEKVGLKDSDTTKVTPKHAGKPIVTLLVGKTSNVRIDGDPRVWSTANLQRYNLVKEAKLWRDRQIMDIPADKMDRLEVAYPAATIVAKRESPPAPPPDPKADPKKPAPPPPSGPDKWTVISGADKIGGAVDENAALELASTISHLTADDFAPDGTTAAAAGLEPPVAQVTVTPKEGAARTLLLGKVEGEDAYVKLKDGARIWKIHKWEAERIPSSPAQWRDKVVLKLDAKDVSKIEIVKGDKDKTILERVDDKTFKASAPAELKDQLDQNKLQGLLRTVETLRVAKVLEGADLKALGLDKPRGVTTLTKKDGTQVRIALGTDKDNMTPMQLSTQKDVYQVPTYMSNQIVKGSADLKKSGGATQPHGGGM
jgi:uncharacterized protein DUF4340